jgi:outer membrane receptor for ferrienterochelin and colicins
MNNAVKNIFNSYQQNLDKGALRDAGYVYGLSLPHSFFVGLKFTN